LFASYLKARRRDHGLNALLADPWVHWRYPQDQWRAWSAAEKGRLNAESQAFDATKAAVLFALFILAIAAAIGMGEGDDEGKMTTIAIVTVPLIVGFGVVLWSVPRRLRAQMERVAASPPEAWAGAAGIFCEGEFSPLLLRFRKRDGKSWTDVIRSIPIPEGAAADLARLQCQLHEKCAKAAILIAPQEGASASEETPE
jgi:hypothetical protein